MYRKADAREIWNHADRSLQMPDMYRLGGYSLLCKKQTVRCVDNPNL